MFSMHRCFRFLQRCKSVVFVLFGNDENRIGSATVSGDRQVRVFDVGEAVGQSPTGSEMSYDTRQSCVRILCCHSGRTKRIITEDSPDLFLTVAEVFRSSTSFPNILSEYPGWPSASTRSAYITLMHIGHVPRTTGGASARALNDRTFAPHSVSICCGW